MSYFKSTITILVILSASRLIPHPPNFTPLIALSLYVPIIFGRKFIPAILISYFFTDLILGLHSLLFFTYSSVTIFGLISIYFANKFIKRLGGAIFCVFLFYLITNFGVWIKGFYGYDLNGLINCYILAIPFMWQSLFSTLIYSLLIEALIKTTNNFKSKLVI